MLPKVLAVAVHEALTFPCNAPADDRMNARRLPIYLSLSVM